MNNVLLFFLLIRSALQDKLIQIEHYNILNVYRIILSLGDPSHSFYIRLDLTSNQSIISLDSFNKYNSNTAKVLNDTIIKYKNYSKEGFILQDSINFFGIKRKDYIINDFRFNYIPTNNNDYNQIIGLGSKFIDTRFSITHILYEQGIIDNKKFSFGKYGYYSYLTFGGIPEKMLSQKTFTAKCRNDDTYISWGCKLNRIDDYHVFFPVPSYVMFTTMDDRIFAPYHYIKHIKQKHFIQLINKGECDYTELSSSYTFTCYCDSVDSFPSMHIYIDDDVHLTLKKEELFKPIGNMCYFLIVNNIEEKDMWVIGTGVLSKYNVEFDYDSRYITFYFEEKINSGERLKEEKSNGKILNNIIYITIIILLSGIFFMTFILYSSKIKQ